MLTVHPQFVVDGKHRKKAVILSLDEWKQIVEALEELDDIQSYDSAKESEPEKITFEQAVHEIEEGYCT